MKIKILSILLGISFFFSCSDEIGNTSGQQQENETITTGIRLALAPISQITTRSVSPSDEPGSGLQLINNKPVQTKASELEKEKEDNITDLWVVQYDEVTGSKLKQIYITDLEKVIKGEETQYKVSIELVDYDNSFICFIANRGNSGMSWPATLEGYKSMQHSYANEASVTNGNKLIMTGIYTGPVPIDADVQLQRLAAKLSLTLNYSDEFESAYGFYIQSAQLINVPAFGQYFDESTSSTSNEWIFPGRENGNHIDYPLIVDGNPENIYSGTRFVWYMPENRQGQNNLITNQKNKTPENDPGYLDTGTSYASRIVLEGRYNDNKIRFTLLPGSNNTNDYNIIRNTHYDMTANIENIRNDDKRIEVYYDLYVEYWLEDSYGSGQYTRENNSSHSFSDYGTAGTKIKQEEIESYINKDAPWGYSFSEIKWVDEISSDKDENIIKVYFNKRPSEV